MRHTKFPLILLLCTWIIVAELPGDKIDEMVDAIREKRESKITDREIKSSPFVLFRVDVNDTAHQSAPPIEKKITFSLGAIMNSSAFINGSWYKKGDIIDDLVLETVAEDHVTLKRGDHRVTLFFHRSKKILNIKER